MRKSSAAPMGPPPPTPSDRLLKTDVAQVGLLREEIPLYRFRYIAGGSEEYVGVMAQDVLPILPEAVTTDEQGFMFVDYEKLGTRMMPWAEWQALHGAVRAQGSAPMGPPPPPVSDRRLKTDIEQVGLLTVFRRP